MISQARPPQTRQSRLLSLGFGMNIQTGILALQCGGGTFLHFLIHLHRQLPQMFLFLFQQFLSF